MSTNQNESAVIDRRGVELEYTTLRSEILKRIEMRQQIVSITLSLAGVFLGVGLATESVALIYPPIAMLLAFSWAQNDYRIRDAATYIRDNLEGALPGLRYETHVQQKREKSEGLGSWRFVVLSHGGVFLITQLLAVGIEVAKTTFNPLEIALLVVDLISIVVVIWLLRQAGRRTKHA